MVVNFCLTLFAQFTNKIYSSSIQKPYQFLKKYECIHYHIILKLCFSFLVVSNYLNKDQGLKIKDANPKRVSGILELVGGKINSSGRVRIVKEREFPDLYL